MEKNQIVKHVPVLIIGGGITGLSSALFLLRHGITPMLVERHKSTSVHPRARGFDMRTMELFRELGLGNTIREAGKALGPAWGILRGSNLVATLNSQDAPKKDGKITFPSQMKGMEKLAAMSPESGSRCTQDLSEPLLLDAAKDRGAEIFYHHELVSYRQNDSAITAQIRNRANGEEFTITADYLIAADGSKSPIREDLKVPVTGPGVLANFINIYFEADLRSLVSGREFSLFLVQESGLTGFLTSINNSDHWVFQLRYHPEKGEAANAFSDERLKQCLRRAIGIPDINIRLISVMPWEMTVRVAKQMQYGRIFIAGDAAHTMTPYGGKGANAGVQDAHNLAWKLAAVLKGKAGYKLLKSYSPERQPIGEFYALRSGEMADEYGLVKPELVIKQMQNFIGIPDFTYSSSAIIGGITTNIAIDQCTILNGQAGQRLPHFWLDESRNTSTLDLLSQKFLLVIDSNLSDQVRTAEDASVLLDLNIFNIKNNNIAEQWQGLTKMTDIEALLVRPDGFIAWRGDFKNMEDIKSVTVLINGKHTKDTVIRGNAPIGSENELK